MRSTTCNLRWFHRVAAPCVRARQRGMWSTDQGVAVELKSPPVQSPPRVSRKGSFRPALVVAALGVVFGDIGTSPIYTIQTVFDPNDPHPVPISPGNVFGVVSLIFWSVMIIVTLTYVSLVMRASNDGEGGIMALITLLRRWGGGQDRRVVLALAGL